MGEKQRKFGSDRLRLAEAYSVAELIEMAEDIRSDPANTDPGYGKGGLHLYTPSARRKLDNLSWAIRNRQALDAEAIS
ncbi:MAG: hypothetical protein KKG69_17920 [Alphaproteobacteria bacterium]|uniref:Uncharacterized protein n=1 Tax=viral metagenome TaxID=1070528 RepID=A0A6H1ZCT4_9ZZZZ|nr:hypothetical protein [Alphaproteobacteria bacterium]